MYYSLTYLGVLADLAHRATLAGNHNQACIYWHCLEQHAMAIAAAVLADQPQTYPTQEVEATND